MKKISFFCIPAHGHTNPMLPVAAELVRRGNIVRFYSFNEFAEKIKAAGAAVGVVLTAVVTVICLLRPPVYSMELIGGEEYGFDDSYSVSLADERYGSADIVYLDSIDEYVVHANFRRSGDTVMTLVSPNGEKTEFDVHIERNTYDVKKRSA